MKSTPRSATAKSKLSVIKGSTMSQSTAPQTFSYTQAHALINEALCVCVGILVASEMGEPVNADTSGMQSIAPFSPVKVSRVYTSSANGGSGSYTLTINHNAYTCSATFVFKDGLFKTMTINLTQDGINFPITESTVSIHDQASYTNQVILAYETIREFFDRNGFPQDLSYFEPAFLDFTNLDQPFTSPFAA